MKYIPVLRRLNAWEYYFDGLDLPRKWEKDFLYRGQIRRIGCKEWDPVHGVRYINKTSAHLSKKPKKLEEVYESIYDL